MIAKVGVLADKHKVSSDRALTETLGASAVDQGVDIDECIVSVMSTNWKRKETLSLLAFCHPTAAQNSFHPKLFSADSLQSLGQEGLEFRFQFIDIIDTIHSSMSTP